MAPPFRRCLAMLACTAALAGCGITEWFEEEEDPLPGERISVMSVDQRLQADPEISDLRIRLPRPYVNERWSQPGGTSTHALYHVDLGDSPRVVWRADVGRSSDDAAQILAQPVVVGDRVFTMDSRAQVSAFDAKSGKRLWRNDVAPEDEDEGFFGGGLAYADGRLIVTTGFAQILALDAESGEVLWRQSASAPMRAGPAVSEGRVFAVALNNQTIALSAEDGEQLWTHQGIEETAGLLGAAAPATDGSSVIVAYSSGELVSLLADNGRVLWSDSLAGLTRIDPIADLADIRAMPVVDRDLVFAVGNANRMVGIDLRRGARAWEIELGGIEMPWPAGDFVYVLTNDAQVVALRRRDGRIRWVTRLPRFEDPEDREDRIIWQGPVLAGDRLIVAGSHGRAVTLSPYTGEILGRIELPGPAAVSPVVAGGTVYFLTDGATLLAMR